MNRPTRQHQQLVAKVAVKESRSLRKPGRRTKRWRKWIEAHKARAAAS